jgi:bile acid:Na+ symporter, BASS family
MAALPPIDDIIIGFGILFVAPAALTNGLSMTAKGALGPLKANPVLTVMALIGNYIIVPAIVLGFLLVVDLGQQFAVAFALMALAAGAPFVAWIVSLGKGDVAYGASLSLMLTIVTIMVVPFGLPPTLRMLDTGVDVSVWKLAWPLLAFILLPLVIGLLVRVRNPELAGLGAQMLAPISFAALLVHVTLMFVTYWSDFTAEFGSGQIAVTLAFPLMCALIGYVLSPPYILSPVKPADPHRGTKIASMIGTSQRGTQTVICSLIFAFGALPVAGVVALASSVFTLVILIVMASELGARYSKKALPPTAEVTPTVQG